MTDTDKRERTILGLILMTFGLVVFGVVMVALMRTGQTPTWPFVALSGLPLVVSLVGALIAWPDQVGPILSDLLSRWKAGMIL